MENRSASSYDPSEGRSRQLISGPVVITGASGGLGTALVEYYAAKAPLVIAIDRLDPPVKYPAVEYCVCDLSDPADIIRARERISSRATSVELLINASGSFLADEALEENFVILDRLLADNLKSSLMLTLALEHLISRGETPLIVNIASTDAVVASGGQDCEIGTSHDLLYAVAKGGLVTATRALAMKWAGQGIRVVAICPTVFQSPMTNELLREPGTVSRLTQHIPMGRLATVHDIAVATRCCYEMKFLTAHLLPVDGGYLCV